MKKRREKWPARVLRVLVAGEIGERLRDHWTVTRTRATRHGDGSHDWDASHLSTLFLFISLNTSITCRLLSKRRFSGPRSLLRILCYSTSLECNWIAILLCHGILASLEKCWAVHPIEFSGCMTIFCVFLRQVMYFCRLGLFKYIIVCKSEPFMMKDEIYDEPCFKSFSDNLAVHGLIPRKALWYRLGLWVLLFNRWKTTWWWRLFSNDLPAQWRYSMR